MIFVSLSFIKFRGRGGGLAFNGFGFSKSVIVNNFFELFIEFSFFRRLVHITHINNLVIRFGRIFLGLFGSGRGGLESHFSIHSMLKLFVKFIFFIAFIEFLQI